MRPNNFIQVPFQGASDLARMQALARRFPDDHPHGIDLPYRFSSWALDEPQNVGLWCDADGELAGWAVVQTPFWAFDIVCQPDCAAGLYPQLLAWAGSRARAVQDTPYGRPAWFAMLFSEQTARIEALEAAGFTSQSAAGEDSWSQVLMRRPGQAPLPAPALPAGYSIRPLAGAAEAPDYVALHQAVFESKNMTVEWRLRTLQQPAYRPELDLVAIAPDGRLAAFCISWYDAASRSGQVEPLGCHPEHRRSGLGRAILAEGLHRLQSLGAKQMFVQTDSYYDSAFRLYQNIGFEVVRNILVFQNEQ